MTEVEWASCTEPQAMLRFVSDRASDRKLRLFSCACCRKVWHLLPHDWSRQAFEAVEQYLEGSITAEEAAEAWGRQEDGFRAINESRSIENRTEVAADATLAVSWASLPLNPEEPEEERADSRRRPLLAAEQAMHYAG
ncbi:MAG TPA: hypothetical protein VGY66_01255, partial [Gemmataceae bacterium]|nr:hypothetical protein [Gemmataceae bacterium]